MINLKYLCTHLSYRFHTFIRFYPHNEKTYVSYCGLFQVPDPLEQEGSLLEQLLYDRSQGDLLLCSTGPFLYARIESREGICLIGPVQITDLHGLELDLSHLCHSLPKEEDLPFLQIQNYAFELAFFYNLFHEEEISQERIIHTYFFPSDLSEQVDLNYSRVLFSHREEGLIHNPYDQERREVESIRKGDPKALLNSWKEDYPGKLGVLAADPLRNNKNLGIVLVAIGSRAAMEGGLNPELAYSLSDIYINRIEEAKNPEEAFLIGRDCEMHYTRLVQELRSPSGRSPLKEADNPHISKCKDYIFSHLHDRLTVKEIALQLGLSSSYLSTLFQEWEGKSLTDFILEEKIKLAQNMLIYSQYQFIEIATFLGFSSQSHLGKVFKKYTGTSPGAFRSSRGVRYTNTDY